jgi:hypothetical protein
MRAGDVSGRMELFNSWSRFRTTRSWIMIGEVPEPKLPPLSARGSG